VTFDWNFGDGPTHSTNQYAAHAYALPGTYNWSVTATVSAASTTVNGSIVIGNPVQLAIARGRNQVTVSWPNTIADTLLEGTSTLGASAQWLWVTNTPTVGPGLISLTLPTTGNEFLRVRRPW
jgi:PKD repeat protein